MKTNPVGKLGVIVMPDVTKFRADLNAKLIKIQKRQNLRPIELEVALDDESLRAAQLKIAALGTASKVDVGVGIDDTEFKKDLKRLQALAAATKIRTVTENQVVGGTGGNRNFPTKDSGSNSNLLSTKLDHRAVDGILNATTAVPMFIARMTAATVTVATLGATAAAAVVGVTTLAGSLKQLAGAAGLLPAAGAGLVAMGGTLAAAFSGVGTALAAVHENAAGGGGVVRNAKVQAIQVKQANDLVSEAYDDMSRVVEDASKRIADAQRSLDDAHRNVGLSQLRAARDVEDAEEKLQKAKERSAESEENLNEVREEAIETLEDLANALANAHLDERKAAIEVRKAYEAYQNALNDPSRSVAAQEELRYEWERAQQTLVDSKDKYEDLQKEQNKAAVGESDAAKAVAKAQKEREQSQDDEQDALRDLQIAREAAAESSRDAADRVAIAEQNLADARTRQSRDHQDALEGITKAEEALIMLMAQRTDTQSRAEDAMKALTPAAQAFVLSAERMKVKLGEVRDVAQENFFLGMTEPVERMLNTLFPQLKSGVAGLAKTMGEGWGALATGFEKAMGDGDLETIFANITEGAKEFNRVLEPLASILTDLSVVGTSLFPEIAGGLADATTKLADFVAKAREDGSLRQWMKDGIEGVKSVARIIGGIAGILGAVNEAARQAGLGTNLASMAEGLNRTADVLGDQKGVAFQTMKTIFEGVNLLITNLRPGIEKVMDLIQEAAPDIRTALGTIGEIGSTVLTIFTTILGNPTVRKGFQDVLNGLKRGLESVGDRAPQIAETIGKVLSMIGKIIELVLPVIADMAIQMGPAIEALADATGSIAGFLTPISGIVASIVLMLTGLRTASLLMKGVSWLRGGKGPTGIWDLAKGLKSGEINANGFKNSMGKVADTAKSWAGKIKAGLPNFTPWSKDAIKKVDDVKLNMNTFGSKTFNQRGSIPMPKIDTTSVTKSLQGVGSKVGGVMASIGSKILPVLGEAGTKMLPLLGNVLKFGVRAIPVIGWVIGIIWTLVDVIKLVVDNWDSISKWFGDVGAGISSAWANFSSQFQTGAETLGGFFGGLFGRWWSDAKIGIDTLAKGFSDFGNGIREWVAGLAVGVAMWAFDLWTKWKQDFAEGVANVVVTVTELGKRVNGIVEDITGYFGGMWDTALGNMGRGWDRVMEWLRSIPETIRNFFSGAGEWLKGAGRAIVDGLVKGLREAAPWVVDAYEFLMDLIDRRTPHSPPKEGPLSGKNWVRFGAQSIPEAIADGMNSRAHLVASAADGMMAGVAAATDFTPAQSASLSAVANRSAARVDTGAPAAGVVQNFEVKEAVSARATAVEIARLGKVGI